MPSYAFHFTRMFHAQNREEYFLDNWKVNFQSYHMHEKFKCMVMLRESFTFYGLINYRHLILKQRNNISLRIMTILTNIPTKFFFLVEKVIFSSSIFTFYIGGLYRFDFCNRCEMVDDLQQNNMKKKNFSPENMLALLYSSYMWWLFKVVWSFSFSSFIFLSLASTTIKLVFVVILILKGKYLMLK